MEVGTFPLPPSPHPSPPAGGRGSLLEALAFDNRELSLLKAGGLRLWLQVGGVAEAAVLKII